MTPTPSNQPPKTLTKKQARALLWKQGRLRWKLHAAQRIIYDLVKNLPPEQREALIFCARGFGKSFLEVVLALEDCLQNPNVQVAIIGPSLKQAKKIVAPLIKLITKDAPKGLITQHRATDTWHMSNGSFLSVGGFDTILESFRGQTLFNIYMEETGFAKADLEEYEYMVYSVLMPTLRSRIGGRIAHFTTPSRVVDHPLHTWTLPQCKLAGAFYKFTIEDNPLLSTTQIEREIQTLGGRGSVTCDRELFCEIRRDDSITVVTTFDEKRHVQAIEPSHQLVWAVGGDLGYTDDLSAFARGGYDHNLGKVIVRDERWFKPETASSKIVQDLGGWDSEERWRFPGYVKPLDPSTHIVDIQGNTRTDMSALGLSTVEPEKDKFDSTITFIRNEFYNDRLVIHPDCKLLIETLRSATFNKHKTDFQRTSALGHADMLMALVYLLRSVNRTTDLRPRPSRLDTLNVNPQDSSFEQTFKSAFRRVR
jgi:hypothetical protein